MITFCCCVTSLHASYLLQPSPFAGAEQVAFSLGQSPDVNPVKCPPDAFCPAGSTEPAYCMEVFLYKAGDSCQLTPLMVVLLAIFSAGKCWSSLPSGKIRHLSAAGHLHVRPTVFSGRCILCFWKPGFLLKVFLLPFNANDNSFPICK